MEKSFGFSQNIRNFASSMETRHHFWMWVAVAGWWLLGCSMAHAQMEGRLSCRRYTTQDGLPQIQAEKLWQDSRGYIYVGTLSGFVRFDGRSFTPLLKGRRENIVGFAEVGGQVRGLGFRRQWCVDCCDDKAEMRPIDPQGQWQLNNLNAGSLPDGYVLLEDEQEQQRRLCRATAQEFVTVAADSLLDKMGPDRKVYMDDAGGMRLLVPTDEGLYDVAAGKRPAEKLTGRADIYTLLRTDTALLAFASDGIYSVQKQEKAPQGGCRLQLVAAADWTAAAFGLTVRQLRSGGLVIADEHSVYQYDGSLVRQLVTGINLIRDVMVDRWDRLWVASYQGVYCFFNRCFTNYRLTDENDIVRAVATGENGRLVMGTLNGKMLVSGNALETGTTGGTTVVSDDPSQYYGTSAVTIGSKVYMVSHGDLACIETSGDSIRAGQLGLPYDRYRFLAKAGGRLIVVGLKDITAYAPQAGTVDTLTSAIPYPWCAAPDGDGNLWVGTTMGVYRLGHDGKAAKMESPQRLLVTTMDADLHGNVYFASADSLFIIRRGKMTCMNSQLPQLAGHEVRSLHVSPQGYLTVAAVDGLLVCAIGKDGRIGQSRFFDHRNGFTMLEPLMATMAEAADGTVWLPGVEEMTSFRPADLLAYNEEDTYISPPVRWWQHWWVWALGIACLMAVAGAAARWLEKRRTRKRMIRLQREKLERERQIETIRQKAIEADNSEGTPLAKDIVKMTERTADERLTFRTASGTIVVEISDIAYFKGDGNYSQIVTFHSHDTVLTGLGALEKMLDPETFVRADRSTLVNIHNISHLLPKQRRCVFRSPQGLEVEAKLLVPAFKRLQELL